MSKIALSGPASGTATYTISAPTGATDRTITLPDQTATLITNSSGVLDIGSGQLYKDASGNVGIGTSSPGSNRLYINAPDGTAPLTLNSAGGSDTTRALNFNVAGDNYGKILVPSGSGGAMAFWTGGANAATERARIDSSGTLLVGKTTSANDVTTAGGFIAASGKTVLTTTGTDQPLVVARNNVTGALIEFYYGGSTKGSVTTNGTTIAYNTSSDYRLKNTIAPMTGALAKVAALKPCTYKWNADGSDGEGFIAHELAEVVADAVTGEKDAVDADGNPQYQGIDTSFLVATLTAAIQELKAIVDAQGAEIAALKGTQP